MRARGRDDFDDGDAGGWAPLGGEWWVAEQSYHGEHDGLAVALWGRALSGGSLSARVRTRPRLGGERNGYLVFDAADVDGAIGSG